MLLDFWLCGHFWRSYEPKPSPDLWMMYVCMYVLPLHALNIQHAVITASLN